MKKSKSSKPVTPAVDTVWYQIGDEEGVGVFKGIQDQTVGFCMVDITAHIHRKTDAFAKFDVTNLIQPIPIANVRHVSNAYVYGWIQMQKNLIQYRKR